MNPLRLMQRASSSLWIRSILVFILYALGIFFSLLFTFQATRISIFWLPNGITLAILIRNRYRDWPAYFAASHLAYIAMVMWLDDYFFINAFFLGFFNCLEAVIGAWLFLRFTPIPLFLGDVKNMLLLILLAGLAAPAIAAFCGAAAVVILFNHGDYWLVWYTWLSGDATGIILMAPCILAWTSREGENYSPKQIAEILVQFLLCAIASILIFGGSISHPYVLPYFMFPLLLWAGLRFDLRVTTLSLLIFCFLSAWYTDAGLGPFAIDRQVLSQSVFRFQLFFGITITSVLVISAIIMERNRAARERESLIHSLEEAIDQIKTLRGLLPICAHCKKIRDEDGSWKVLETYIQSHSDAQFSHGICPDCMQEHFPKYANR